MSKSESKSRILYIYKMLMEQTDNEHYLTVQQMISQLEEKGINAFRKTVISDIEQLSEFGVDIVCVKSSQNRYHIEKREFMLPELKLLVDAVESSQFITKSKSAELIGKLSDLASTYQADELCREIYLAHRMKSNNEEIYDVVDSIHSAVRQKKQISFLYYEFDTEKKRKLRNDGERYQFSPYGMTWEDSRYYVIGYSEKHKKIVTFRADRMSSVEIMNYACVEKPDGFDMNEFVKQTFRMYDDKLETVTLKCRNEVMKSVIDRFGLDVQTELYADGKYFKAVVEVGASQTFFGWVFQFAGDIQIVKPINVKRKFVEMARVVCGE